MKCPNPRNKHPVLLLFLVALIVTACQNQPQTEKTMVQADTAASIQPVQLSGTADSIVYDSVFFPSDTSFPVKILTEGNFHQDEVTETEIGENWYGLFKGKSKYYLSGTRVSIKNCLDPIVDEDTLNKTGWEVKPMHEDTCILLIADKSGMLKDNELQEISLERTEIFPGDSVTFNYQGMTYMLTATGGKKVSEDNPIRYDVWNYKLYLTAVKNGQQVKELLFAQPAMYGCMINIAFAGDIDGDSLPDFVIDNATRENQDDIILYLSKPANTDHLLQVAGRHTIVGC
jgi:hypothetical protein